METSREDGVSLVSGGLASFQPLCYTSYDEGRLATFQICLF